MNTIFDSMHILGIRVTTSLKEEILEFIRKYLNKSSVVSRSPRSSTGEAGQSSEKTNTSLIIVTPNPEQIVLAQKDKHFSTILNSADVALPDGIGLVAAMRLNEGKRKKEKAKKDIQRIPGVEFMEELVRLAAKNGWPVAFIGGREGVAEEALLRLKKKYPGLVGWAEEPGELPMSNTTNTTNIKYYQYIQDIIKKIKKTNTKFVFVGLGAPKQEYFIAKLRDEMVRWSDSQMVKKKTQPSSHPDIQPLVFMSVGGSFDTIAGRVPRAPIVVRSKGLEWLWRLILEPWRFRRQLALLKFLWLIVWKNLA